MKKQGFTLIELLAVIVILAIIALVSIPLILNLIDDGKKGAFQDTAYGIVEAAELAYTGNVLDGTNEEMTFTYNDGVESSSVSGVKLNYKGTKPKEGIIKINNQGQIAIAIHDGILCAEKGFNDIKVTVSEKSVENCKIVSEYVDSSGASTPEITTGMIPVKWNGTDWVKADLANKWYDYSAKEWANAVTVTSTKRAAHLSAAVGSIIPMSDINTMWVWVPRYKYAIPAGTGAREINIVFESKDTPKSAGNAIGTNYLTHPAFTFGTTEVSGIWVGKFETTGTIDSPTIKPNVASLRDQKIKAMYDSSRNMENNTTYGTGTDGDIHMAKGSEWGAVSYLSHSKYGKNSEIWINNSSTYTTGCAGSSVSAAAYSGCQNQYHTVTGVNASATGNIYGVYDMSGGVEEYVMSMLRPTAGDYMFDESGFDAIDTDGVLPESKYWDRYTNLPDTYMYACNNGICYGYALSETSNWYGDSNYPVEDIGPWSTRGGDYNSRSLAGIFSYYMSDGNGNGITSFRLVQLKQ